MDIRSARQHVAVGTEQANREIAFHAAVAAASPHLPTPHMRQCYTDFAFTNQLDGILLHG